MSVAEAEDYIDGLQQRSHNAWAQTRMLSQVVHKLLTGQEFDLIFPWEESEELHVDNVMTDDDLQRLRAEAKAMEEKLNAKNK